MKNKDKVYYELKSMTEGLDLDRKMGITSNEIAARLNMRRNVVSQFLNEMCQEGNVVKINTRPVYFLEKDAYDSKKRKITIYEKQKNGCDPFKSMIGYNTSLKIQIEQCRSAVTYPPNGLAVLLIGETGVGKSYLARIIYDYAKEMKAIKEDAPFVVFNCAEYANNQELLSANLFGYKKGSFTGAEADKPGILEEADGGYLFLDEVHRLPPEGQEKLFLFLDQKVYRRLGEVGKWRSSNVRFIFATTENPEENLLRTFLRRIPIIVKIPPLSSRVIYERLQLVHAFYKNEAENVKKDILVSKQVLNVLLRSNFDGNIGKLANIIKYSCAHSYNCASGEKCKRLVIHLYDLPGDLSLDYINDNKEFCFNDLLISLSDKEEIAINNIEDKFYSSVSSGIYSIVQLLIKYDKREISLEKLKNDFSTHLNKFTDEVVFKNEKYHSNSIVFNAIHKVLQNVLKIVENYYGVEFHGNSLYVFSCALEFFLGNMLDIREEDKVNFESAANILKRTFSKDYIIGEKILELIGLNLDVKPDYRAQIYLTLYINLLNKGIKTNDVNSIIIAHGYSTASSIASVANRLLGSFIFEAFDMPVELPTKEIMSKVQGYLSTLDTSKGLMILIDMGSLDEIYKPLAETTKGDIGIINNITTQLALDVGNRIMRGQEIETIINETSRHNNSYFKFIKGNSSKKDAIITTCITGIGTAEKIKILLAECFRGSDIEILAYDYDNLKTNKNMDNIFREHNVKLIVGTADPMVESLPFLSLEDLISGKGELILRDIIKTSSKITFENINNSMIKLFSLQNVLNSIIILNPDKILNQVEMAVSDLELHLGYKLPNDLKVSLYIHISCLIERVMMNEPISLNRDVKEFEQCHRQFIKIIKAAFSVIEKTYNVDIPISEIEIIYEIIQCKLKNINI